MRIVLLIGMFTGWAMIGHVVATRVLRWRQSHRTAPARSETQLERIARLEIACGVGLSYGRDAVIAAKVRVEPYMQDLFDQGNGAVRRECWNCGTPFAEFDHDRHERDGELSARLCPECLAKARAELEYGVPIA